MFHYTKAVLRVGVPLLWQYFTRIKRWARHLERYPSVTRFAKIRKIIKLISDGLGVDVMIFGLENIPTDTNYCLVCNHMSAFDPIPFIINSERHLTFVGKKEIMSAPFVPAAMKVIEGEYIDRDDLRQSLKVMLRVEDSLKQGEKSWMIFPEGTRIRDQLLPVQEFHHGTFRPATKAKVPIIPCAIYGSFRALKKSPQFKKYPVSISFLKPMMPEDYAGMSTAEIASFMRDQVQREITYHLRPLDHKIMSEAKDKKYRFNQLI
ncbi:MAG: 1-acyl-sn-glycerol-3-phosphate acyltransferase [Bacilli bacterium]|nr:1-acyl-sn-glycerol-3-phosphate acyltransferase [Bacilli bacterium]